MKQSQQYYIRVFWSPEDKCFIAEVPELKGCSGLGKSEADAIREARRSIENWLAIAKKQNIPIPEPITLTKVGRLNLRLPADLIQKIRRSAKETGLSLNQFVMTKIFQNIL